MYRVFWEGHGKEQVLTAVSKTQLRPMVSRAEPSQKVRPPPLPLSNRKISLPSSLGKMGVT